MNLGERIKAARIRARLSQRALARQLGVSAMAVCKYERGEIRPHSNVLNRMAEILKVDTDFFFRSPSVRVVQMLFSEEETISQAMESELRVYLEEELGRWLELEQLRKGLLPDFLLRSNFRFERKRERRKRLWRCDEPGI